MTRAPYGIALGMIAMLAMSACGKRAADNDVIASDPAAHGNTGAPTAGTAPSANNTDTLDGGKLANFTGHATAGEKIFLNCKTCHSSEAGKNMIGPSLHGIVGHPAGANSGFAYATANKSSGIVWTEDKLFQYLEAPQRIVPGTKMTYAGIKDPQQRADVIAYLKTLR